MLREKSKLQKGTKSPIRDLDRPSGLQEVEAPRISRKSAHEVCNVVSTMYRPTLPMLVTESTPGL